VENGLETEKVPDSKPDMLSAYITQFEESESNSRDERTNAEVYRDYYDGKQWTSSERAALEKRGQPCITDNRTKDKVEYLLGFERQTRTDPKAYPRNPTDEQKADLATDALRYIAESEFFPQVKSRAFENKIVEGIGGCEVIVEPASRAGGNPRVRIRQVRWDRFYRDPFSYAADFSDAQYMGVVVWMDVERAKQRYPSLAEGFEHLMKSSQVSASTGETFDDKPRWVDHTRNRVQILEHYHKVNGVWHRCVFSKAGIIEPAAPSAYLDDEGNPECPLIMQSCYVDREGRRYGVVARYKDLQDEINKRRSKALHMLSVNQIVAEEGALSDVDKSRKEAAKPDGVVIYNQGFALEIQRNTELATGQFQLLQDAMSSLSVTGPNEALRGQAATESGRAQEIAAQGGQIQVGILFDGIRHWQSRVMRAVWNRVRQFWTAEQWIRVTDDERMRWVKIDPSTIAQLDVDIMIDEAPDTLTLQQEQWTQLTELAGRGIAIPPDVLIQASGLKNKQQLIDRISGKGPDGSSLPPEVGAMIQQKEMEFQQRTQLMMQAEQELQQKSAEVTSEASALEKQKADLVKMMADIRVAQADIKVAQAELKASKAEIGAQISEFNVTNSAKESELNMRQKEVESLELQADPAASIANVVGEAQQVLAQQMQAYGEQLAALAERIAGLQEQTRTIDVVLPSGRTATATVRVQ